jgi:hypothetical protein
MAGRRPAVQRAHGGAASYDQHGQTWHGGEDSAARLPTGDSAVFEPGAPLTVPVGTRLYARARVVTSSAAHNGQSGSDTGRRSG